jgi:hypothetical protein
LLSVRAFVAVIVLAAVLSACGDDQQAAQPAPVGDPGIVHVHGLGRNPADGSLMIATHTGLFRVGTDSGEPKRVADLFQDTMGFTVVGPDHFLGSGHPGRPEDPPFLGLIESRDAGNTWRPVSLRGRVDFHVLESQGDVVYGFGSDFETREARFLASGDFGRSWKRLSPPEPLTGLAIDPRDPQRLVAVGENRGYTSRDGGATWRRIDGPGGLVTWTAELGLVAVDSAGVVRSAADPTAEWREVSRLGSTPAALEGAQAELLVATHEAQVLSSRDGGRSWQEIVDP